MLRFENIIDKFFLGILRLNSAISIDRPCAISRKAEISTCFGGSIIIGKKSEIHNGAIINTYGGNISIGEQCSINPYTIIYGNGGVKIGESVRIASHCSIISFSHNNDLLDQDIMSQGLTKKGIIIENNVWIGSGSRILDGVVIKSGCIIGAGSVVTKSTERNCIYVGTPAKLLRVRSEKKL
jgi:acetyltransferase-like isoleucine patch superfamily enzyme